MQALEEEGNAEKHQLAAMHQQRVLAHINQRKREAMTCYTQALTEQSPNVRLARRVKTNRAATEQPPVNPTNHHPCPCFFPLFFIAISCRVTAWRSACRSCCAPCTRIVLMPWPITVTCWRPVVKLDWTPLLRNVHEPWSDLWTLTGL